MLFLAQLLRFDEQCGLLDVADVVVENGVKLFQVFILQF